MERIDKARFWVVLIHVISFCIFLGCGFLKQFGFFVFQESDDITRVVFMTTEPFILWIFAVCFGLCLIFFLKTRTARSAFIGAGVHGVWAIHCTHQAFIGWISEGTALTIVVYWLATIKLVREAFVIARNKKTEQGPGD